MGKSNQEETALSSTEANVSLGEKLWGELEAPQGYAFVSDSILYATDDVVRKTVKQSLPHARKVVKILKKFSG